MTWGHGKQQKVLQENLTSKGATSSGKLSVPTEVWDYDTNFFIKTHPKIKK